MKKIMAVLIVLMCFASTNAFAQLNEVRGVQTRVVEYQDNDGETRHGFEFKNENSYAVWVEAELWMSSYILNAGYYNESKIEGGIKDTKSFTLNTRETYVWKCGDKTYYAPGYQYRVDAYNKYYVKYKAYKTE